MQLRVSIVLFCLATLGNGAVLTGLRGAIKEKDDSVSTLDQLVHDLVSGNSNVRMNHIIGEASKGINFRAAVKSLKESRSIPAEVSSLLMANASASLTEESLTKAREFLNGLVEAAYIELDNKIIEAKEFEDRNRGTWQQVVADIARLGSQIAGHMKKSAEATSCLADVEKQLDAVKAQRQNEKDAYDNEYSVNYADMTIKQNDLDVFDFLIKTTKTMCDEQAGLLQVDRKSPKMEICDSHDGASFQFRDAAIQAKFDRMMTKGSRDLLRNALMRVKVGKPTVLLQVDQPITKETASVPVVSGQSDDIGSLKCGPIPDCGLLYDTLSLNWGGYKDQVDELKKIMSENAAAWTSLKADFDAQINSLVAQSDECTSQLAEATANKNHDQQILAEKMEDKRVLDEDHEKTMKEFKDRIKYIFNQDICGPIVIRNEVMKESTECAPKNIDDCDTTPWMPEVCSVECDDNCPEAVGCGGLQRLNRDAIVRPNQCGIKCPALTTIRKCNQFKCPVDCLMSRWSGFSKCSKDCEGGVQEKARDVLVKPLNGGKGCPVVSKNRGCNIGSCDRDCTLEDWTSWSPCSMACDRGNQKRVRNVDVPIRGFGKCPRPQSTHRLEWQDCNVQQCVGDEICIAVQDLVVSVDSSGSVNTESWALVKNFTGELLKRYKFQYYGIDKMQIGLILFGNGAIEDDGTISKAILLSELTSDIASVRDAAAAMEHQKGFTNMAQSFNLAEKLLQQRGRKDAQGAVMTISDGQPSFLFETTEKAKELTDKGIMKYMIGINEFPDSKAWQLMKSLATEPYYTNTVRVPGFDALQDGGGPFVREAITKFCPESMSPSLTLSKETARGYMLVKQKGYCGTLGKTLGTDIGTSDECFNLARDYSATGFSMGRKYREGKCCVELEEFTCDHYKQWQENPDSPVCPANAKGFTDSRFYDWYALEPNCA